MNAVFHLLELYLLGTILYRQSKAKQQRKANMATIEERFAAISAKMDEASQEILALIQKLRDEDVTPAAEAILVQIEAKANALADIVPNIEPTP